MKTGRNPSLVLARGLDLSKQVIQGVGEKVVIPGATELALLAKAGVDRKSVCRERV